MSRCSALLPIKCRDNKDIKELAAIGLGGINLEKPVGGGRITVVFDKKDVPDSDMRGAMELGESWFVMVSNSTSTNQNWKITKIFSVHQRNKKTCKHFNNGMP